MRVEVFDKLFGDGFFLEKLAGDKFFLFEEPNEYQSSNQADNSFMVIFFVILSS